MTTFLSFTRWWGMLIGGMAACWALLGVATAQPRPDVTAWVEADTVRAGEPFTLIMTSNTPAHRAVGFPPADADSSVFGELTVLTRSAVHKRRVGVMYAIDSVAYTVTTSAVDSVRVPPLPVWVDAAVDTVVTHTQPFTVPVVGGGVAMGSTVGASSNVWMWGLLVGGLLAAFGGGVYLWRTREGDAAPEEGDRDEERSGSSGEDRQDRWQELDEWTPTGPEEVERFYVALADTIGGVLSDRLDISTRGRTTQEVTAALRQRDDVPATAVDRIEAVMREADLVKFARERPEASTARAALRDAREALDAIDGGEADDTTGE